jgi:hypothetical protein
MHRRYWNKKKKTFQEEDPDPEVLRLEMGSILDLIRFPTIEHLEFCRHVGA